MAPKIQINVKLTTALWMTRQEDVWPEIASLLGVPEASTGTKGWFDVRMKAIGNLIARMSPAEKEELMKERDRIAQEGHPEEIKRK
jgi:hypothetical protein